MHNVIRPAALSITLMAFLGTGIAAHAQADAMQPPVDQTQPVSAKSSNSDGVRIVRLSQVRGEVEMDRNVDHGYETAFANLPITHGSKLKTGLGVAEVELEDNSSLRLTPQTTIEFTQLRREPSGFTTSTVNVISGTLYVSLAPTRGNQFTVTSGAGTLVLEPSTHIHLHVGSPKTTASILDGSVTAQVGSNTVVASKKTTLVFDPANQAAPTLVSHLEKDAFDSWDKDEVDYHKRYMNTASFGNNGPTQLAGVADLNYYGNFADLGCGNMWRPYLASAAWDPYGNGILAYYPNSGYSWVSPYPWGWAPYHSGNWVNCGAAGWGWQPGGNYYGLNNMTSPVVQKHGAIPVTPPKHGHSTLLAVTSQPLAISKFTDENTFVFAKDSAGLGVPRNTFGKLQKVSEGALQHGSVTRPAYYAPVSGPAMGSRPAIGFTHAGSNPTSSSPHGSFGGVPSSGLSAAGPSSSSSLSAGAGSHGANVSAGGGAHR